MEMNENLVTDQVAENVEQTTEESPKIYSEADFNAKLDEVLGKKVARREAKIRKEYERKYGGLTEVLKAGTGKESVDEITDTFREFYRQKGVPMRQESGYSDEDVQVLARADAEEIIRGGYDEVVEEVERLTALGAANMSPREKAVFQALASHRQSTERGRELAKIGVTEDEYTSPEFTEFAAKFHAATPVREIYDLYAKTKPKKEVRTMGSMKNSDSGDSGVKDFYTPEEARKFTKKDFDSNPALFKAVENSMLKWKK